MKSLSVKIADILSTLRNSNLQQRCIQILSEWDPSQPQKLKINDPLLLFFLSNSLFRYDLIRYLAMLKAKKMYDQLTILNANYRDSDLLAESLPSDSPLPGMLERVDDYIKVENYLMRNNILCNSRKSCSKQSHKKRLILLGVIYLLIKYQYFKPNFYKNSAKLRKLTEKDVLIFMSERFNLVRIDRIKENRERLIELARENVAIIDELENNFKVDYQLKKVS